MIENEISSHTLHQELSKLADGVKSDPKMLSSAITTNTLLMGIWRTNIEILRKLESSSGSTDVQPN